MIKEFQKQYRWLSNFWLVTIDYEGKTYPSVEHAYQAAKFHSSVTVRIDEEEVNLRELIRNADSPGAKRLGRRYKNLVRPDWHEGEKLEVMEQLEKQKFTKHLQLKKQLLETGGEYIQEGNWWHDEFWGVDLRTGKGSNHLGKIIMKVRDEIRKGE